MQITGPIAFYNTGYHIIFYSLITVHACLFLDVSSLQKKPLCDLNFLLAVMVAAAITAATTSLIHFPSYSVEIFVGAILAVLLSALFTLTLQRFFDYDVYF